jgi:hypothetical protein
VTPTNGTGRGDRLDRWLLVDEPSSSGSKRTAYQVEIKNWSGHAIGGRPLSINADETTLRQYRQERWLKCWDPVEKQFLDQNMGKVLSRMLPPAKMDGVDGRLRVIEPAIRAEEVQPMLCFWWAVHPEGKDESLFRFDLPGGEVNDFSAVWVFSMSNYLRSLSEQEIQLDMPSTVQRLAWLRKMFDAA